MNESFAFASRGLPLRITIATGIYPPQIGGPATYAKNLSNGFSKLGNHVEICTYGRLASVPTGVRHFFYTFLCLVKSIRSDFIVALDNFSVALPSVLVGGFLRKKVVVRLGGDFLWESYVERCHEEVTLPEFYVSDLLKLNVKEKIIFRLVKWILKHADFLVFSTKWQLDLYKKVYQVNLQKCSVIENYYPSVKFSDVPKKVNFVWAGRNIYLKNLNKIKQAFEIVKKTNPEVTLDIVSSSHEDLIKKIRESYATISVSLSEISPNFVIESLYNGKPFITTLSIGIRERMGDTGYYADPHSVDDIVSKIHMLADSQNYSKMMKNIENFKYVHTWDDIAKEFIDLVLKK
jgi:glycosyltransferase involved in cell wall biosynthesis